MCHALLLNSPDAFFLETEAEEREDERICCILEGSLKDRREEEKK